MLLFGFLEAGLPFSLCFLVSLTQLTRGQISIALGVPLVPDTRLHERCYLLAFAPCRALTSQVAQYLQQRVPMILSRSALRFLEESLIPRAGYGETISVLQQWLLSLVMGHVLLILRVYCFVNGKRMPYAYSIHHLLSLGYVHLLSSAHAEASQ